MTAHVPAKYYDLRLLKKTPSEFFLRPIYLLARKEYERDNSAEHTNLLVLSRGLFKRLEIVFVIDSKRYEQRSRRVPHG